MPTRQEQHVLPEDTLKVSRLNRQEREFLIKHMGSPKRVVEDDPPARPCEPHTLMAILDRLRDEPKPIRDVITDRLQISLEYEEKKKNRMDAFGYIDYDNVGVGLGLGQTKEEQMFDVSLSIRETPDEYDWASEFRAPGAGPVIADSKEFRRNQRIYCHWCEENYSGERAASQMGLHIYHKHREFKPIWDEVNKTIRTNWEQGITFESKDEQMKVCHPSNPKAQASVKEVKDRMDKRRGKTKA